MKDNNLIFGRRNYTLLIVGIAVLLTGFIVMSLDSEQYGFGFLGITLGPAIVCLGFVIPFFAIFIKSKQA